MSGAGGMGEKSGGLRLGHADLIQMMQSQANQGVEIEAAENWPPIAWVLMQAEAEGMTRKFFAESMKLDEGMLTDLIGDLIRAPEEEVESIWSVGVLALKVAATQTTQILGTTWDQVEAMAISRLADAIQAVPPGAGDPMKLASIAKTANSAVRRNQGEGAGRGIGTSVMDRAGFGVDVELQSGELGSIRFRLSPKVIEQMNRPDKVIDISPVRDRPQDIEMLRLKEIRPIAEQLDSEEQKAAAAKFVQEQEALKKSQEEAQGGRKMTRAEREMARLKDMFSFDEKMKESEE